MYSVYILSLPEGDYIGVGLKPCGRLAAHLRQFLDGTHPNPNIRKSKSNVTDWVFRLLETNISEDKISERETYWIGKEQPSLNIKTKSNARLDRDWEIVESVGKGATYREAALQFGVSLGTVSNAISRTKS